MGTSWDWLVPWKLSAREALRVPVASNSSNADKRCDPRGRCLAPGQDLGVEGVGEQRKAWQGTVHQRRV